jgi:glycosyltransferase involved in cell wall biosynthesis
MIENGYKNNLIGGPKNGLIRIAHVTQQLDMGGMEKLLVEFARHVDRSRFDLRFVSLTTRGGVADEIESCGWPATALGKPSGLRPTLTLRLCRLFRQWKIDLVHTHNRAPLIYAGMAARLARVRGLVHTRHGQNFGESGRQTALFRLLSLAADRVVCVSRDAAHLSTRQGLRPDRLVQVWNGIDLARFSFTGPNMGGPAVMVGRMSPEKDPATLLRATALVVRQMPSFQLVLAGDGPCQPSLISLIEELDLSMHVRLLGEVRDIPTLLARASLLVLPSISEGISLTILEAMARGLPVVATKVGGNPEVVINGETGWLVPPRCPGELAAAILRVYCDPESGRRMGLAGRRRVESHFDVCRMVSTYESLYLGILYHRSFSRLGNKVPMISADRTAASPQEPRRSLEETVAFGAGEAHI